MEVGDGEFGPLAALNLSEEEAEEEAAPDRSV